jgi:MoaA/NifB/PqqE/SkfB family radical SAM enzyme
MTMNDELKTCPICENAVQIGSCDAFVIHPVSPCELSGKTFLRTIWQESALVNALRAQLVEKDKEIARLTCLLKYNDIPTGDNEFLRGA